jgi:hypothetical protein
MDLDAERSATERFDVSLMFLTQIFQANAGIVIDYTTAATVQITSHASVRRLELNNRK